MTTLTVHSFGVVIPIWENCYHSIALKKCEINSHVLFAVPKSFLLNQFRSVASGQK